jgi:hypothetical protein
LKAVRLRYLRFGRFGDVLLRFKDMLFLLRFVRDGHASILFLLHFCVFKYFVPVDKIRANIPEGFARRQIVTSMVRNSIYAAGQPE